MDKIRIGISACLLGEEVRFDGGHKHDRYITKWLGKFFSFEPICPEVGIGMGIPRPTIRLVKVNEKIHARGVSDASMVVTEPLSNYYDEVSHKLTNIRGYILKRGSPSCGMERVKVYTEKGMPNNTSSGLYAAALLEKNPNLPVEEEGRLGDPVLRENFIARVFVYDRWLSLLESGLSADKLLAFHTQHKMQIMAHNEVVYRELGRMLADLKTVDISDLAQNYIAKLMAALKDKANSKSNTNVLQHLAGYLKQDIDPDDKAEWGEVLEQYRLGKVPLIVPMTLLKHHFRKHPNDYVSEQTYLAPHPAELMLRNLI